jgi:hypothetical protein
MVGALIGAAVTIVLAIVGVSWRISARLAVLDTMLVVIGRRVDHIERIVDPSSTWNRDKNRRRMQ